MIIMSLMITITPKFISHVSPSLHHPVNVSFWQRPLAPARALVMIFIVIKLTMPMMTIMIFI